jgi:predicted ATPase
MSQPLSKEVRQLARNWSTGNQWPKRLEWIEISGIRGWAGERVQFSFPVIAICGENGVGKSTILQAAASIYRSPVAGVGYFASQFFPDTPWDKIQNATIKYSVREGQTPREGSVRKPTARWLGNPERRERHVKYLDLRRTQPIVAQRGYQKMTKTGSSEAGSTPFDAPTLGRYSSILGRTYSSGKHSWTSTDPSLKVAVVGSPIANYSAFHQGAGENTVADLVALDVPKYSLLVIDEVETSLHPRAQRRLVRYLADLARLNELQIILTTHSPYVLEELPPEARIYVPGGQSGRVAVSGISAQFAMTNMDDETHPEADIYVEDEEAARLVREVLSRKHPSLARRVLVVPAGAASVVCALGQIVAAKKFPRPTIAVLDGDQSRAPGCLSLPCPDAPERTIVTDLRDKGFPNLAVALGRTHTILTDAVASAVTQPDHHDWIPAVCDKLLVGRAELWGAFVREWLRSCLSDQKQEEFAREIADALNLP